MGTMLRTAAAIGCDRVLLTKGSVNIWSSKVLRAATLAHLRLTIYAGLQADQVGYFIRESTHVFLADNNETSESLDASSLLHSMPHNEYVDSHHPHKYQQTARRQHVTLVIGNESRGISSEIRQCIEKHTAAVAAPVRVPLANGIESLNCAIAFAIIGYDLRKWILAGEKKGASLSDQDAQLNNNNNKHILRNYNK